MLEILRDFSEDSQTGRIALDAETLNQFTVDGQPPSAVVWPENIDQLANWLKAAYEHRAKVLVWGGGTHVQEGGLPSGFDLVIGTTEFNSVIDYDHENLTVSVEAGITLERLQKEVAKKGLCVPLDPPRPGKATVGGIVAANAFGPRGLLHGSVRDLLLGTKAVLAGGTAIKVGGKTVKNVAGYDLSKLFVGSRGTLGVLTEVTFRLVPIPENVRIVVAGFDTPADCAKAAQKTIQSRLVPTAVEILNSEVWDSLGISLELPLAARFVLLVLFEGKSNVLPRIAEQAQNHLATVSGRVIEILDRKISTELWSSLVDFIDVDAQSILLKAAVPITETEGTLEAFQVLFNDIGSQGELLSHYGCGIVYALFSQEVPTAGLAGKIKNLRGRIEEKGGSLVVSRAPVELKREVDVWGTDRPNLDIMRKIKAKFDPRGVFVSGRFVGGI